VRASLRAALLLALGAASPAAAGERDFVYVSGELDDFSPGGGGGSGGVLWTRDLSPAFQGEAGASAYSLDGTRWAYGRLGATLKRGRATLHADANVGAGSRDGAHLDYRLFRGSATVEAVSGRLWADAEVQHLDFAGSEGALLKLGAAFAPRRELVARAGYYHSAGGNLGAQFFTLRADLQPRRVGYFAGLSIGRSRPELLRFFSGDRVVDSTEVYGGVRLPLGPHEITAYLDTVDVEGTRRTGLAVLLKLKP
jgi:hypothetical protein